MSLLINLPEEIHDEIFLKLPADSLVASRCVCKLLYNLLSKPSFIKNHVNRTNQSKANPKLLFSHSSGGEPPMIYSIPIDYASISSAPPASSTVVSSLSCVSDGAVLINYPFESKKSYYLDLLGSSNGLIFLKISFKKIEVREIVYTSYYSIFNPLTREFKDFTHPRVDANVLTCGFGYDSNIDDYKVVMISDPKEGTGCKIDIYKVKSDSWSGIQGTGFSYSVRPSGRGSHAVFFNGALHWLGFILPRKTSSELLISFDISNETMLNMPLPAGCCGEAFKIVGMWGDCICISIVWNYSGVIDVWVMHEYGVKESWIKRFTTAELRRPCTTYRRWKPLLLCENERQLLLHDTITKRVPVVCAGDISMDTTQKSYVDSIATLGSGTYMKKRITDETVKDPE